MSAPIPLPGLLNQIPKHESSAMFMNILMARDVAAKPAKHSLLERQTAAQTLLASAEKNKDRQRAAEDRVLANRLAHLDAAAKVGTDA